MLALNASAARGTQAMTLTARQVSVSFLDGRAPQGARDQMHQALLSSLRGRHAKEKRKLDLTWEKDQRSDDFVSVSA